MKVAELVKALDLKVITTNCSLEAEVKCGFVGDLLSVVMGKAEPDCAWVTVQSHVNIVAVALLINAVCVIVSEGYDIEEEAILKAEEEDIVLLSSTLSSYALISKMHAFGIE